MSNSSSSPALSIEIRSTRSGGGVDGAGFLSGCLAIGLAGSLIFSRVVPS